MHKLIPIVMIFALPLCLAGNPKLTIHQIELKAKIAQLVARDQVVRKEIFKQVENGKFPTDLAAYLNRVDQENYQELNKITANNDFSSLDDMSVEHLWLLSQHADREPKFQKRMLLIYKRIGARNFHYRKYYAYLYDRIQINRNFPQRYGTQGKCISHHKWQAFPIENPSDLNRLRANVGLDKFMAYQDFMNKLCN